MSALFLLKIREDYSEDPSYSGSYQIATGMWNSAKFVVDTLNARGYPAMIALAIDGNSIDRLVMRYNPSIVFIEGLWVVPEKIAELQSLARHADREWVVRVHSEIPFLASEGIAFDWIMEYLKMGTTVAPNSPRVVDQIKKLAIACNVNNSIPYLPNCYPTVFQPYSQSDLDLRTIDTINVGLFGAYRVLKNHVQQALNAIQYAKLINKKLRLHVNSRVDASGQGPYRNVAGMFKHLPADEFELVEHGWESRELFLQSLAEIDVLLQDSISETFNIVAADAVLVGRPVLGSSEIPWLYPLTSTPTDHIASMQALEAIMSNKVFFIEQNRASLIKYANQSANLWLKFLL